MISPFAHQQSDLQDSETLTNDRLMQALDTLNQRYGWGTVKVSTQGEYKEWQMLKECKSPSYTTCWDKMPVT